MNSRTTRTSRCAAGATTTGTGGGAGASADPQPHSAASAPAIRPPIPIHSLTPAPSCLRSVALGNPAALSHRRLVVVGALLRALRNLDLGARDRLVRDLAEQMGDAVEAAAPLVVGAHDVPGRFLRVRGREHRVARARVVVPEAAGFEIGRRELPLPH